MNDVMERISPAAANTAWTANMVRPLSDKGVGTPASFLRKSFSLGQIGGGETLRISALGLYRCFINGVRVGNDLLTPGWTAYDKRLSYQTYAVGDLLKAGENEIEIWLADGWLRSQMMWGQAPIFNTWGDKIAAIAELRSAAGDRAPAAARRLVRHLRTPKQGCHLRHLTWSGALPAARRAARRPRFPGACGDRHR